MPEPRRFQFRSIRRFALVAAAILTLSVPSWSATDRAVIQKVPPSYPEMAKRLQISGVVKVEATVEPNGSVSDVKTVSGNHMLSPAAEMAVRKWKFEPGPAKSTVDVEINFAGAN
jgi:TonB family protein